MKNMDFLLFPFTASASKSSNRIFNTIGLFIARCHSIFKHTLPDYINLTKPAFYRLSKFL